LPISEYLNLLNRKTYSNNSRICLLFIVYCLLFIFNKIYNMKRSIYLAVGILFSALFYSCELLPDLNPNTSEGADILILHPNDVLISARTSGSNAYFYY
jgi:hypothetical protein